MEAHSVSEEAKQEQIRERVVGVSEQLLWLCDQFGTFHAVATAVGITEVADDLMGVTAAGAAHPASMEAIDGGAASGRIGVPMRPV